MQASNCLQRQPIARLARISRFVNTANAILLVVAGGFGFWGAALHPAAHDAIASVMLSVYTIGFGALLLRFELRLGSDRLQRDFGFLYTFGGRCAVLLLTGNLVWTCDPLGLPTAIATNVNAGLNAYLLISHPSFTSGQLGWASIEDLATGGESGGDTFMARDPAAVAQSARAAATDGLREPNLSRCAPAAAPALYEPSGYGRQSDYDDTEML